MRHISLVLVAFLVAGCGSSGSGGGADSDAPGKFDQTWTTSYSLTTCSNWENDMDSHEKFVMAGDMLVGAWEADGVEGVLPPDDQIRRFVVAISRGCRGIDMDVTEMAAMIYLMADDLTP